MDAEASNSDLHASAQPGARLEKICEVTWSMVHSRSTLDIPTNSRTTVMIDQSDRICAYCNELSRGIEGGTISEEQIHAWWSDLSD